MKIVFVPPIMYLNPSDLQPHMGLSSLRSVLHSYGYTVEILSLNPALTEGYESYRVRKSPAISEEFYREAVERLLAREPDLVGFSTVGSSYPTTLVLVNLLKALRPDLTVILGGIQATLCAEATMRHFPAVDYIIAGEAEGSFPIFLRHWQSGTPFPPDSGVYYRTEAGAIAYSGNAPLVEDLDSLPKPDFTQMNLAALDEVSIDVGRGCPFQCYYCCTNNYWRRTFRLRSAASIADEIEHLYRTYGKQYFSFNHDLLTCNRKVFTELLQTLKERDLPIRWKGSARLDTLDEELLKEMAGTGCYAIFLGIETGSPRMQRIIRKHLEPRRVLFLLDAAQKYQIRCTTSFISGMPEETWDDLAQTIELVYECIARYTAVQIHLLAPFQGTEVFALYRDQLRFDGRSSNVGSFVINHPLEEEMIRAYPDIFCNFYYLDTPHLPREMLQNIEFLPRALPYFWRTIGMLRYTYQVELADIAYAYLRQGVTLEELPEFIRNRVDSIPSPPQLLQDLFAFEMALFSTRVDEPYPASISQIDPRWTFRRKTGSRLYLLSFHPQEVEECIRRHQPVTAALAEPMTAVMSATCRQALPQYNLVPIPSSVTEIYGKADGRLCMQDIIDDATRDLQGTLSPEQVKAHLIPLFRQMVNLRILTVGPTCSP